MATLVLGEFTTPDAMMAAARKLREEGATGLDGYTPYPVHGLEDALGLKKSIVPVIAGFGGLTGVVVGYSMQWFLNGMNYPIVVGGKPPHSPPLFLPVTFELGILLTAFSIFFGLMFLFRFPRPHHPVFEVEQFKSASTHAFWLSAIAPAGKAAPLQDRLRELGASHVAVVEGEP